MEGLDRRPLLKLRGMTWHEFSALEELQEKCKEEHPDDTKALSKVTADYVMSKVYPYAPLDKMTYGEVMACVLQTITLSQAVRYEEFENLKPAFGGSTNGQATVTTAEN